MDTRKGEMLLLDSSGFERKLPLFATGSGPKCRALPGGNCMLPSVGFHKFRFGVLGLALVFLLGLGAFPTQATAPPSAPPVTADSVLQNLFYGATLPGASNGPALVFVHGLSGSYADWLESANCPPSPTPCGPKGAGIGTGNDMYDYAYEAGFRTAFVSMNANNQSNSATIQANEAMLETMFPRIQANFGGIEVLFRLPLQRRAGSAVGPRHSAVDRHRQRGLNFWHSKPGGRAGRLALPYRQRTGGWTGFGTADPGDTIPGNRERTEFPKAVGPHLPKCSDSLLYRSRRCMLGDRNDETQPSLHAGSRGHGDSSAVAHRWD